MTSQSIAQADPIDAIVARLHERRPNDTARISRGEQIAMSGAVRIVTPSQAAVTGSQGDVYCVDVMARTCECPDFKNRDMPCKHIFAATIALQADAIRRASRPVRTPAARYEDLFPACASAGCDESPLRNGRCLGHQRLAVVAV